MCAMPTNCTTCFTHSLHYRKTTGNSRPFDFAQGRSRLTDSAKLCRSFRHPTMSRSEKVGLRSIRPAAVPTQILQTGVPTLSDCSGRIVPDAPGLMVASIGSQLCEEEALLRCFQASALKQSC